MWTLCACAHACVCVFLSVYVCVCVCARPMCVCVDVSVWTSVCATGEAAMCYWRGRDASCRRPNIWTRCLRSTYTPLGTSTRTAWQAGLLYSCLAPLSSLSCLNWTNSRRKVSEKCPCTPHLPVPLSGFKKKNFLINSPPPPQPPTPPPPISPYPSLAGGEGVGFVCVCVRLFPPGRHLVKH